MGKLDVALAKLETIRLSLAESVNTSNQAIVQSKGIEALTLSGIIEALSTQLLIAKATMQKEMETGLSSDKVDKKTKQLKTNQSDKTIAVFNQLQAKQKKIQDLLNILEGHKKFFKDAHERKTLKEPKLSAYITATDAADLAALAAGKFSLFNVKRAAEYELTAKEKAPPPSPAKPSAAIPSAKPAMVSPSKESTQAPHVEATSIKPVATPPTATASMTTPAAAAPESETMSLHDFLETPKPAEPSAKPEGALARLLRKTAEMEAKSSTMAGDTPISSAAAHSPSVAAPPEMSAPPPKATYTRQAFDPNTDRFHALKATTHDFEANDPRFTNAERKEFRMSEFKETYKNMQGDHLKHEILEYVKEALSNIHGEDELKAWQRNFENSPQHATLAKAQGITTAMLGAVGLKNTTSINTYNDLIEEKTREVSPTPSKRT